MTSLEQIIGVQLAEHVYSNVTRDSIVRTIDRFSGDVIVKFSDQGLLQAKQLLMDYIRAADADEPMWDALAAIAYLCLAAPVPVAAGGAGQVSGPRRDWATAEA